MMKNLLTILILLPSALFGQRMAFQNTSYYMGVMAPRYGALVNGQHSNQQRAHIAKELKATHVRMSIKSVSSAGVPWDGNSELFDIYEDSLLKVVLDIDSAEQLTTRRFPVDMVYWAGFVTSVLNQHQPDLLVIGNEPLNDSYYDGPLSDYVRMLEVASPIAHARNISITCGGIGLNGPGLMGLTYRWLKTYYSPATATAFGNNCLTSSQRTYANSPGTNANFDYECRQHDTILNAAYLLDYINIHSYEVLDPDLDEAAEGVENATVHTDMVWRYLKEYVEQRTKKPCITNEVGVRGNTQPALVTDMLNEAYKIGFKYFIWYSGTGPAVPPAFPLHNLEWDGTGDPLYLNGHAYRDAVGPRQIQLP